MQDDVGTNLSSGSPWAWFPLAVLMSLSLYLRIEHPLTVWVELYLFLPLLTGWLASRFGRRVSSFLLALGLMSPLHFRGLQVPFFPFSISLGIPLWIYVLTIFTALAFARPRWSLTAADVFEARWRWLRWLALVAVCMSADWSTQLEWELSDTSWIYINPGFVLLVLVLAAGVNWSALSLWFRKVFWSGGHAMQNVLTTALVALVVLALLLCVQWKVRDALRFKFGIGSGYMLVVVVAFLLAAFSILEWRQIVVLLVVIFVSNRIISSLGEALKDMASLTLFWNRAWMIDFPLKNLICPIAAVLLGIAIAPFWRHKDPDALRTRRTALFLFLTLVVSFFGMQVYGLFCEEPLKGFYLVAPDLMTIGGAAYVMGLNWQVRGIIAGPLIIQMLYLLQLVMGCADANCWERAYESVNIGLITFAFAFFGLLSNRYLVAPSEANPQEPEEGSP